MDDKKTIDGCYRRNGNLSNRYQAPAEPKEKCFQREKGAQGMFLDSQRGIEFEPGSSPTSQSATRTGNRCYLPEEAD